MRATSIDGWRCSRRRRARFAPPPRPGGSSSAPVALPRASSLASPVRTAFCSARANATGAKRDLCARARLFVGEQREQNFSLVPDDAHKRLRLRCFSPLYIGVADDDGFDGDIFDRRIGLDDLGAIQIDQDVLNLGKLLLKRKQTACLARIRFGRKRFREGGARD